MTLLLCIIIVIFITHFVGAITAYGSTLLSLPLLLFIMGGNALDTIVVTLLLVGTVQAYQVLIYTYKDIHWPTFFKVLLIAGCGLPLGLLFVHRIPRAPVIIALGFILVAAGLYRLLTKGKQIGLHPIIGFILLFVTGMIHGAYACGGMTLTVYMQDTITDKNRFRGTINLIWVTINTILIIVHVFSRTIGPPELRFGVIAIPFVLIATWFGQRMVDKISQVAFARVVSVVLVIGGVITVMKGFLFR